MNLVSALTVHWRMLVSIVFFLHSAAFGIIFLRRWLSRHLLLSISFFLFAVAWVLIDMHNPAMLHLGLLNIGVPLTLRLTAYGFAASSVFLLIRERYAFKGQRS